MNKLSIHPSQRGHFAFFVFQAMKKNKRIWVVTNDLGYKMWDQVREKFPERFINAGAAEQAMLDLAVGLALEGKIPIVYSITSFLLFRPFETIKNYIDHEKIPVKLIGGGRDRDYLIDGPSHWASEDKQIMKIFKNIHVAWPESVGEIEKLVKKMLVDHKPWYLNLRR
ncbi:hypothetical protein A2631_01140 [Candidatus Daviesbacteria bacterium RIFCSPHIGHO2_01_FULL_44_29]|uniref:Transketolase-like pyrimidine-binding domain-containing protein n=1 Tax=Candidatus Daviesbacteria bacterium RIFCSPHIGHO2_02_FULL_43_12 TaxID=1797776 RepID=A0A1F5KJB7_9BACT|nr:MAG: hypothetical protein A2631_01140 [Candidatus Daviesbacteria bacterium RIFCSPHIGHO2_01_FULL_44_29]OGE40411.1 MAG: hypothetical protein A3E86_03140 [Candidatus Daviesbacteria bacterium RIFCSPHIGHO2_12_FULL_47_45]OGE40721.1 MAG: hypothetical protein A3D25_05605 [Candidatus Daviesbacteria bacterium RIFCSPHIGHO2_02_FULL_43_12]OGE69782.1 MAG: hypothetical protein A3B55_05205 [Candidatus Daviesbacteria bacterium RIFCSPLOWO2_01_FULL_43_15]